MKNYDAIDSCIILGTIFEKDEKCKLYTRTIGYKLKNKGLLTVPLIGEIFTNLLLKIAKNIDDPFERKVFLQNVVDFFDETILSLLFQERLIITKLQEESHQHILRIKEIDYAVTDDDAIHLSAAIYHKCQGFITTDRVLLREEFKGRIKREFGLIIKEPS